MVYVLSEIGQPLMPTENHAKVRILLKQGKAKVVRCCPFTIQLLYSSTNYTQKGKKYLAKKSGVLVKNGKVKQNGKIYTVKNYKVKKVLKVKKHKK